MKSRARSARVWRWNAYIIFVAGLLAIAALLFLLGAIIADEFDDSETNVVSVAADRVETSSTRYGEFKMVSGTNVLRAPLHLDQKLASTISKENSSIQNYLYFDPQSGASYWLVSGRPTLLASAKDLPSRPYMEEDTAPVAVVIYEQVSRDSDGDERLTNVDLKTIAVSDGAGRRFTPLLNNVSVLHAAEMLKDGTIVILYEAGAKMRAAHVDPATFRVMRDTLVQPR